LGLGEGGVSNWVINRDRVCCSSSKDRPAKGDVLLAKLGRICQQNTPRLSVNTLVSAIVLRTARKAIVLRTARKAIAHNRNT